jgi:DNA-binding CsgD family transcriptional regulator
MNQQTEYGKFSLSKITGIPANLHSPEAIRYKQTLPRFPEEAIYIYSFAENKMIYADGWDELLGYENHEINMLTIVKSTAAEFVPFSYELNDKALQFILGKQEQLEKYSFSIELKKLHKNGTPVPLISRVGVFEVANKQVVSIIGHLRINRNLTFGKIMHYAAYGPEKNEFEEELNKSLFYPLAISNKEKDVIKMAARGLALKQMAHELQITQSAIEKRIRPMYKRFGVNSLPHLVSFAYENHILP